MGTPSFMAPEQARGRWDEVDARTDLWAVGATLFTLITGKYVHEAETVNEVLAMAITTRPRSITAVDATVPAAVAQLVDRALLYEKDARWASASEMQTAIRAAHQASARSDGALLQVPRPSLPDTESDATLAQPWPDVRSETADRRTATAGSGVSTTFPGAPGRSASASSKKPRMIALAAVVGAAAIAGSLFLLLGGNGDAPVPASSQAPAGGPIAVSPATRPAAAVERRSAEPETVNVESLPKAEAADGGASPKVTGAANTAVTPGVGAGSNKPSKGTPAKREPTAAQGKQTGARKSADPFAERY
jgi:serine/threonine-protein kinase